MHRQKKPKALDYCVFLLFSALSCHGETLENKEAYDRPPAQRGLCGYELLYTKQLNQEQCASPMGRKAGEGGGVGEVEGRLVQIRWSSGSGCRGRGFM